MSKEALQRAIAACDHSQSELARRIGKKQGNIWDWLQAGKVPAEACIPIEKATGGLVTRYELRPDIYPAEDRPFRNGGKPGIRKSAQPAAAGRRQRVA
jgi:DNA-binding transcriptional regulator YdaS (Cro superfamily)